MESYTTGGVRSQFRMIKHVVMFFFWYSLWHGYTRLSELGADMSQVLVGILSRPRGFWRGFEEFL